MIRQGTALQSPPLETRLSPGVRFGCGGLLAASLFVLAGCGAQGDDDGFVLGLINKYGDQAQTALDKLDAARNRLKKLVGRNAG